MEETKSFLKILIDEHNLKKPQGIKAMKNDNIYFIWIWCGSSIFVYETLTAFTETSDKCSSQDNEAKLNHCEITLSSNVIDIFNLEEDSFYVLDASGIVYLFQTSVLKTSSPRQFMDTEDIFVSPMFSRWKRNTITKLENCDYVISVCQLATGMAILAAKDKYLVALVYSLPEFNLIFLLDLDKYTPQESVLSSCTVKSLSPSLQQYFQDSLEVFDSEIIIVGLLSGLVFWFYVNTPVKGPFVMFSAYDQVHSIHWIKDTASGLNTHLFLVLSSGPVVIFGQEKIITLYLPDSVQTSLCLKHYLITSNLVDCYASELELNKEITLNCVCLPVKGVCAITAVCHSDMLLLAATANGSVYCLNPTTEPSENPLQFAIPEQSLLDNMFLQTQNLESIYTLLNTEDDILKAILAARAANSISQLVDLNIKVISETEFSITAKLTRSGIFFSSQLWLACIDIIGKQGNKKTSFNKLKQDFSNDSKLILNTSYSLSIEAVVTLELVAFLENQQPLLIVSLGKIEIDACHLMATQVLVPNLALNEESLGDILSSLYSELTKPTLQECKLVIKVPDSYTINSFLSTILQDSRQRISDEEWNKISGGKKYTIQISIHTMPVLLKLEVKSRELTITCCNIQLCHQVKKAILKRLCNSDSKHISENLALHIQALYQTFEIESLKDEPDFQYLETLRKKLRSTISLHLPP